MFLDISQVFFKRHRLRDLISVRLRYPCFAKCDVLVLRTVITVGTILELPAQPNLQKLSYSRILLAAELLLVYNYVDCNGGSINLKKKRASILKIQSVCLDEAFLRRLCD